MFARPHFAALLACSLSVTAISSELSIVARGRTLGAMPKWTLSSLLSPQAQEPIIQTPDYTSVFANEYLRKQKCSELRAFLSSGDIYCIVEGPPGSLKTACVQRVAKELGYALREVEVDGEYKDDRSRTLAPRLFSTDMADIVKGNDGRKVVTLVYNVDLANNPAAWVLPKRREKTAKVIFELHDTPKEMAPLVRQKLVRKISFGPATEKSMRMIAAAIAFRNPPRAALQCGDAHMLYTASMTQSGDAWKDTQLNPFREAEEVILERRVEMLNWKTPFVLQQHCHKFMSLKAQAAFMKDLGVASMLAAARRARGGEELNADLAEYGDDYQCPFLAISARLHTDRRPSHIDWSGELKVLKRPRHSMQGVAIYARCHGLTRTDASLRLYAANHAGTKIGEPGATATVISEEPNDTAAADSEEPEAKRRRLEDTVLPPPCPVQVGGGASSSSGDNVVATVGADAVATPVDLASFKYEGQVLVASDARTASFYLTSPHTRRGVAGGGLPLEKFTEEFRMEAKRDLPDRFKKFTLLIFEPDQDFTVEEFWVHFARTIGLRPGRHQDAIAVCSWPNRPKTLAVAYQKQDQRKVSIPCGFCERYVTGVAKKGETRYSDVDVLSKLLDLGTKQVRNFVDEVLDDKPSAIEVVSAVQSQEPGALALTRLEAALVPPKERTPFERALTSEWQVTKTAVKQMEERRTQAIYASKVKETGTVQPESVFKPSWRTLRITIHDRSLLTPLMPRVGGQTSNVVTMETYLDFPGLHQNVTLFITGEPRKGKSELAKLICLLLAFKYQAGDPHFLMTSTLDALRASQALMLPGVPVLLDDIGGDEDDAQLIYSSVSMWKAILQVKDPSQIRGRSDDIMWAARQPKVISSNCKDLADWVNTMFPRAKPNHKEAIPPRVAECEPVRDSLYSGCVAQSSSQNFLPAQRSTREAADAVKDLYD